MVNGVNTAKRDDDQTLENPSRRALFGQLFNRTKTQKEADSTITESPDTDEGKLKVAEKEGNFNLAKVLNSKITRGKFLKILAGTTAALAGGSILLYSGNANAKGRSVDKQEKLVLQVGPFAFPITLSGSDLKTIDLSSLEAASIQDINTHLTSWRGELNSDEINRCRDIIPQIDMEIGKQNYIKKGDLKIAEQFLEKSRDNAKNKQDLIYAESSYYFGLTLLKTKSLNYITAHNNIVRAHDTYYDHRLAEEKKGRKIPNHLKQNIAKVSTTLGNMLDKEAQQMIDENPSAYNPTDEANILLAESQKKIETALSLYEEAITLWPDPKKNPAHYYGAMNNFRCATDRKNWMRAEGYLTKLKKVINRRDFNLPEGENKQEWKKQINDKLYKIRKNMKRWVKVKHRHKILKNRDCDAFICDDGKGNILVQQTLSNNDKKSGIDYRPAYIYPHRHEIKSNNMTEIAKYIADDILPSSESITKRMLTFKEVYG